MLIDIIAGTRPNFIKIAPIIDAIQYYIDKGEDVTYRLIHTGQHYDQNMSANFFTQLNIPTPDINLEAGGGTQAEQTAAIMIGYEKVLETNHKPFLCLVVGDVTSTMACSIVAKKANIKVAHVEAGIRSGDWTMPEEINRILTDSISDYFFTTTETASTNLMNQGIEKKNIFLVGNTMIDTLLKFKSKFIKPDFWDVLKLEKRQYILLTIHRPANVDDKNKIKDFLNQIILNSDIPIIFPVHPRTAKIINEIGIVSEKLFLTTPLGYLQFNYLTEHAKVVITDSGGITEETTVMNVPCITLRDNTERPETVILGTNELIGTDPKSIKPTLEKLFSNNWKTGKTPFLWDGKTARRIVEKLIELKKAGI